MKSKITIKLFNLTWDFEFGFTFEDFLSISSNENFLLFLPIVFICAIIGPHILEAILTFLCRFWNINSFSTPSEEKFYLSLKEMLDECVIINEKYWDFLRFSPPDITHDIFIWLMAVNISAAVYSFFDIKFSDLLLIMVYLLYFFISLVFIFISSGDRQYIKHQLKYKDREYKDSSKFLYYYLSFFFLFLNLCSIILYYYSILSFFLLLFLKNYILEIINIFIILQNFCDYNLFPLNFDVLIFSLEQFYENSILFSLNSDVFDSIMFYATIFLIIFSVIIKNKKYRDKM